MAYTIRPLNASDDLEQVFDLFKQAGLTDARYATDQDHWDFQYNQNPYKKSWNSVLVDSGMNKIIGRSAFLPFEIRTLNSVIRAGVSSSGVIAEEFRKIQIPFEGRPTFAIVPLMNHCCSQVFQEGQDILFAHSRIVSWIRKVLGFSILKFKRVDLYFGNWKGLWLVNYRRHYPIKNPLLRRMLVPLYALLQTSVQFLYRMYSHPPVLLTLSRQEAQVDQFEHFDQALKDLFRAFDDDYPDLITYNRSCDYLNWRFRNQRFKKFKFILKGKIIGYCIIEQGNNPGSNAAVVDFILLKKFIKRTPAYLYQLRKNYKINFIFPQFVACIFSKELYQSIKGAGYHTNISPKNFFKRSFRIADDFYVRLNKSNKSLWANRNHFYCSENWYITLIFSMPKFFRY